MGAKKKNRYVEWCVRRRFCDEMRRRGGAEVGGSFCVACLAVCNWYLIPERPTTTGKRCTTSTDTVPSYSIQCTVCCGKRDVCMVCNQEGYFGQRGSSIVGTNTLYTAQNIMDDCKDKCWEQHVIYYRQVIIVLLQEYVQPLTSITHS
jgi:hypothetical protein